MNRIILVKIFVFLAILAATSLACNFPAFVKETPTPAEQVGQFPEADAELAIAEAVDDRPGVIDYLGRPDAFDISIVEVEGELVRMESWRYYQFGIRVDFVDGEALWTMDIDPMPEGTIFAAWYDPLTFKTNMPKDQVIQLVTAASPAGFEPEEIDLGEGGEDLVGGTALVGDQILIGLYQDRLLYVETIALSPEGGAE